MSREEKINKMIEEIKIRRNDERYRVGLFPIYHIEFDILLEEIGRLNNVIKHADSWIDRTIEVIKQQPSEDDTWILERLNGIKQCLRGSDKE